MISNLFEISKEQLIVEAQNMKYGGYRFITSTCVDTADGYFDVIYHFDKDLEMKNYRVRVKKEEEVQSISQIYFCAVLTENEMKELFGLNVINMAIDYQGHMLLSDTAPKTPMAKQQITIERREASKNV